MNLQTSTNVVLQNRVYKNIYIEKLILCASYYLLHLVYILNTRDRLLYALAPFIIFPCTCVYVLKISLLFFSYNFKFYISYFVSVVYLLFYLLRIKIYSVNK